MILKVNLYADDIIENDYNSHEKTHEDYKQPSEKPLCALCVSGEPSMCTDYN